MPLNAVYAWGIGGGLWGCEPPPSRPRHTFCYIGGTIACLKFSQKNDFFSDPLPPYYFRGASQKNFPRNFCSFVHTFKTYFPFGFFLIRKQEVKKIFPENFHFFSDYLYTVMKKVISESELASIISESVNKVLTESFGVAQGAEAFADYILKRCLKYKSDNITRYLLKQILTDEPPEPFTAFTLTRAQVVKWFNYPLPQNFKKLNIVCCDSEDFDAQLNTDFFERKEFNLLIPFDYFVNSENYGKYKEIIMHELTHFTNYNQKNIVGNIHVDEGNITPGAENFANAILYLFQDTEINARLTSFWYGLNRCLALVFKDGVYYIQSKVNPEKSASFNTIQEVITTLKSICDNQLNYRAMRGHYLYLMDEATEREDITFGIDTFPMNPGECTNMISNVYFAILFGKIGLGIRMSKGNGVFRLPSIKSIFGKRELTFNSKNPFDKLGVGFTYEGIPNQQVLERKYNEIRNLIRTQLTSIWTSFNKRADRIAYEWCMKQLNPNKENV